MGYLVVNFGVLIYISLYLEVIARHLKNIVDLFTLLDVAHFRVMTLEWIYIYNPAGNENTMYLIGSSARFIGTKLI